MPNVATLFIRDCRTRNEIARLTGSEIPKYRPPELQQWVKKQYGRRAVGEFGFSRIN